MIKGPGGGAETFFLHLTSGRVGDVGCIGAIGAVAECAAETSLSSGVVVSWTSGAAGRVDLRRYLAGDIVVTTHLIRRAPRSICGIDLTFSNRPSCGIVTVDRGMFEVLPARGWLIDSSQTAKRVSLAAPSSCSLNCYELRVSK